MPEYQLTANVWARAILEDDFGVKPTDIHWVRGGIEHAGRPEKITIKLPKGVRLEDAPGRQDDFRAARQKARSTASSRRAPPAAAGTTQVGWLFRDPVAAAKDYYKRTGIFPIMHLSACGARSSTSIPGCRLRCSRRSSSPRRCAVAHLSDTSATKVTMPFIEERIAGDARAHGRRLLAVWR